VIGLSALPLLAYKVGPNLFDLSSQMYRVSLRDQMHRAVALAESLVQGRQVERNSQVLIVGAGVAGVAAGIVLARHGVQVQIIDVSNDAPFALQRNVVDRSVGAYMYEWPLDIHASQQIPPAAASPLHFWTAGVDPALPCTNTYPAAPDALVGDWDAELNKSMKHAGGQLRLQVGVLRGPTNAAISAWLAAQRLAFSRRLTHASHNIVVTGGTPWRGFNAPFTPLRPRFVLLAAGMGTENCQLKDVGSGVVVFQGKSFWANDDILKGQCGCASAPRVVVLGGGDGGLQDCLRALTSQPDPLVTWNDLLKTHRTLLESHQPVLTSLEAQHAQTEIWAAANAVRSDAQRVLDEAYANAAGKLAQSASLAGEVIAQLRPDVKSVHLCIRENYFTKAYGLNRFMVHLFEQCLLQHGNRTDKERFKVIRQCSFHSLSGAAPTWQVKFDTGLLLDAEVLVVRYGADTSMLPGQWLGLTRQDTVNRQELAAVPLPLYLPPSV